MDRDLFSVLAEPTRRRIMDQLRDSQRSVNELVHILDLAQPVVSKHLRVLREAGLVVCTTAAQQRIYRIDPRPLRDLDVWLARYRQLWIDHLDALEQHLDHEEPQ